MNPDVWVKLYEDGGGYIIAHEHEEPRIDAAVSDYLESGGTRDRVLALDCVDGSIYRMRASGCTSWYVSTPEQRRAAIQWEADHKEEADAMKRDAGIWEVD